ncbi:MAG: hypothetical protein HY332_16555 [Chloroflexi bacterium]|nr:hypothetical protein [Chloroflexota bacterium]
MVALSGQAFIYPLAADGLAAGRQVAATNASGTNSAAGSVAVIGSDDDHLAALMAQLPPAIQPVFELYLAHRAAGEHYDDCFARLGAPMYAAMLNDALAAVRPLER